MKKFSYYLLNPQQICDKIYEENHEQVISGEVKGIKFAVFPHVYPSHKFRSTAVSLHAIKQSMKNKIVCDMGCGPGIVGLFALNLGAKFVVQADINPYAVENAKENNLLNDYNTSKIVTFESDAFDNIPEQFVFDVIVFNMPYHTDEVKIDDPLKYAFYDPKFDSIKKVLKQAKDFSHPGTEIFVAFSNKGDTAGLEAIFNLSGYQWELATITNTDQEYDNRMYRLIIN